MKNIDEIVNSLPNLEDNLPNEKDKNPYQVLLNFANAIEKKYHPITAEVSQISRIYSTHLPSHFDSDLVFSFYLNAPIGQGYYYLLFEVIPQKGDFYPVKIKLFGDEPIDLGLAQSDEEFQNILLEKIFNSTFVKQLFSYIIANVNLKRTFTFTAQNKILKIPFDKNHKHKTLILREIEASNKDADLINDSLRIYSYFEDGKEESKPINLGVFYSPYSKLGRFIIKFGLGEGEDKHSSSQITISDNCIKIEIEYKRNSDKEILDDIYLTYSLI